MIKLVTQILHSKKPVLINLTAKRSLYYDMMNTVLKEAKYLIGSKAIIMKIDVETHPEIITEFGIKTFPAFLLFKNGKIVWKQTGSMVSEDIVNIINSCN